MFFEVPEGSLDRAVTVPLFWGAFRTNTGETYLIRTIDQVSSLHQDRPRLRMCVLLGSLGFESRAAYSCSH